MKIATLFLSDLHMGASRQSFQGVELLACLEAYEPERIIINGDFMGTANIDPTDPYYKNTPFRWLFPFVWDAVSERIFERFAALAASGTEILLMTGNHDHHVEAQIAEGRSHLSFPLMMKAYTQPFLALDDMRFESVFRLAMPHVYKTRKGLGIWIEHGHAYAQVSHKHPLVYPLAAYILSGQRRAGAMKYWHLYRNLKVDIQAATTALAHGAQAVMTGHYHAPDARVVKVDGQPVLYMNTGDWIGNATAIVEKLDGELVMTGWYRSVRTEKPIAFNV